MKFNGIIGRYEAASITVFDWQHYMNGVQVAGGNIATRSAIAPNKEQHSQARMTCQGQE